MIVEMRDFTYCAKLINALIAIVQLAIKKLIFANYR